MSDSQMFFVRQDMYGVNTGHDHPVETGQSHFVSIGVKALEYFLASGFGSRGGPNKLSNKLKRRPSSYFRKTKQAVEDFLATGIGSRGGANKMSNKLHRHPSSYFMY